MKASKEPYQAVIESPIKGGITRVGIRCDDDHISHIDLLGDDVPLKEPRDDVTRTAVEQLQDYFSGRRHDLNIPVRLSGTPFQQRVWQALRAIPWGKTRTYGDIAHSLRTSPRAVGGACRSNPVLLVVPCHRVVATGGTGGFHGAASGAWPGIKSWLLAHEQAS